MKLRQVYRWIERKQVASIKSARATKVSRADVARLVEQERKQEVIDNVVTGYFDGQEDTTDKSLHTGITIQLVQLQNEKAELQSYNRELNQQLREYERQLGGLEEKVKRIDQVEQELTEARRVNTELSELRRQEALTIGQLQERVRALEAARAAPQPPPAPAPPATAPIVVQPVETPQNVPQPKKKRWWQF